MLFLRQLLLHHFVECVPGCTSVSADSEENEKSNICVGVFDYTLLDFFLRLLGYDGSFVDKQEHPRFRPTFALL